MSFVIKTYEVFLRREGVMYYYFALFRDISHITVL